MVLNDNKNLAVKEYADELPNWSGNYLPKKLKLAKWKSAFFELTDKSLAIAKMGWRLNALFDVLEQTADSGVGKKIGNMLAGKH